MLEERRFFVIVVVYVIGVMFLLCIVAVVACMHVDVIYDESWEEAEVVWYGAEMT